MKNKLKLLYKIICFCILLAIIFSFKNTNTIVETKASNINVNKSLDLNAMAKVIDTFRAEDIMNPLDTYNGKLTAYVANCPLCSGKLGCTGQNVLDGTTTYNDSQYGLINIVASSPSLPCGSIVRFKNNTLSQTGEITAIVLDRGVTGTTLDLLVDSTETAFTKVGTRYINYDILRFGWTREKI